MRVTVTGGCGFVGRHLVNRLLESGETVVVLDDFSTGSPGSLPRHRGLRVIQNCVTDPAAVREAVRGADLIYHLASVVGQINVTRDPGWSLEVSSASVRNLNAAAPETPLVLFSSSAVYGLETEGLCREERTPDAEAALAYDGGVAGYASGKLAGERLAAARAPGTALTVRPFNIVGPGQLGSYGMVLPRFVRNALEGRPITLYGTGRQTRSFGDVRAFLGHLLRLVDAWRAGRAGHAIYNLGTPRETSIEQLADTVDRVLGVRAERHYLPFEVAYPGKADVQRRRPCLERIERELGPLDWPTLDETVAAVAAAMTAEAAGPPRFTLSDNVAPGFSAANPAL